MRRTTLLALSALLALGAACGADGDRTGIVVTPGMHYSTPHEAYSPNPFQPTRFGQMLPPEGSRPYGSEPLPQYGSDLDEAKRAGEELTNPIGNDPADLARGEWLFATYCEVCHGAKGDGDGPIIGRYPNPPSLLANHAKNMPEGRVWHVITYGQGIMPPYRYQVQPEDRWPLVRYVRETIQGHPAPGPGGG